MISIAYRDGYKYQLAVDYVMFVELKPTKPVETEYIRLRADGELKIRKGYAWDGPSGPTIDTPNFMRGSLVHDALYQLIRERDLPKDSRKFADELLHKIIREDGMGRIRSWWVYRAVRLAAGPCAMPSHIKPVKLAP